MSAGIRRNSPAIVVRSDFEDSINTICQAKAEIYSAMRMWPDDVRGECRGITRIINANKKIQRK